MGNRGKGGKRGWRKLGNRTNKKRERGTKTMGRR